MKALITDEGTAAYETALCEKCFKDDKNQNFAREMGNQSDDVDPKCDFVDCSKNTEMDCCVCGINETEEKKQ